MTASMTWLGAAVALALAATGCGAGDQQQAPEEPTEGYVTMDDGVRLYYRSLGSGTQTVVVPMAVYLADALAPLAEGRRVVFYDPRSRGRSDHADTATVSLDRQIEDLEQLRTGLGIERMALIGWSGLGMEMAVYAMRHPERVTRLVQVGAVPPASAILAEAGGDARRERMDLRRLRALVDSFTAGEFDDDPEGFCRTHSRLTLPASFVDSSHVGEVPDICAHRNEWPVNLWPYFSALLGSFGDYDWREEMRTLEIPRLVIHGREDGIPLAGGRAWAAGYATARLLVLSPAGHFPFLEQPGAFFPAVDRFLRGEWPDGAQGVP